MFLREFVEKINTHILWSITIFKNCVVYEMMRKNVVGLERPQMTISATNTHTQDYVIRSASPWQKWLHEGTSMLRYTCIA